MDEQEKKQNKHVFKIVLIILGMLAFGALGFYFGSRCTFTAKEKKAKTENVVTNSVVVPEETEEETSKVIKTSNVSEEDQNKMKDMLDTLPTAIYPIYKDSDAAKTFKVLVEIAGDGIGSEYEDEESCTLAVFSEDIVKEYYQKYFTGSPKLQDYVLFIYNNGEYRYTSCGGYVVEYDLINYIDSYNMEDNNYYIYEYIGVINGDGVVYNDIDANIKITTDANYTIDESNKDNFTKYVHKFVKLDDGSFLYDSTYKAN